MKPMIGVMPLWDEKKDSIWMLPGYMDGLKQAGGIPFIFPFTTDENDLTQLIRICDGFMFTGGHDVSPEVYHERTIGDLVECCEKRDTMESIVLGEAIKANKPIFGICRGIQFINAALGGSLFQDIPSQHPSVIEHRQPAPYDKPCHDVSIVKDSPLYRFLQTESLSVNSCHHQAVKKLAPPLKAMAFSPDGLVEALYMPDYRFLLAVQWHPEFSYKNDECSRKLFQVFVEAMTD